MFFTQGTVVDSIILIFDVNLAARLALQVDIYCRTWEIVATLQQHLGTPSFYGLFFLLKKVLSAV